MADKLQTAIFRFSNQEGDAISAHRAFLDGSSNAYVWWGWWKKDHELNRGTAFRELRALIQRDGPVRIALVNRKDDEYFRAEVDAVAYNPDGKRTSSPDDRCPSFYKDREQGCPAWLRITRIDQINPAQYNREFGEVPTGDPTLYEIRRRTDGATVVVPHPAWHMPVIRTSGDTLLHISDLHFGSSHGFAQKPDKKADSVPKVRLMKRVLQAIEVSGRDIGIVVLSGDLVSKGNTEDFQLVGDFLDGLLAELGLAKDKLVIVPGNHDFKTIDSLADAPTMNYAHERSYRDFLSSFLGWPRGAELERLQRFELSNGENVVFASLNSARLRGHESKEYGYVGRHRYAEMLDHMQADLNGQAVAAHKFAVLHHHLIPVIELEAPRPGIPVSLTVDASELFGELQLRGFDAVLHGHQHLPFFFRGAKATSGANFSFERPKRDLIVVGNGTTGAGGDALIERFPFNTVGLHRIGAESFDLDWIYYTPAIEAARLASWEVSWEIPE